MLYEYWITSKHRNLGNNYIFESQKEKKLMQLFQNYLFTKSIGVGTIFLYLMLILFISHLRILSLMFQFDKGYL